jgi:tetratricopeptide (TPR) repeat protein
MKSIDIYNIELKSKNWDFCKNFLLKRLKKEPDNFWLLTSLASVYYELLEYKKALQFAQKAYNLNPESPLVLWDLATALSVNGREEESLIFWKSIIDLGKQKIGKELTTEGISWALSLINDCKYRIAKYLYEEGFYVEAIVYINDYLYTRKNKIFSLYTMKKATELQQNIELSLQKRVRVRNILNIID